MYGNDEQEEAAVENALIELFLRVAEAACTKAGLQDLFQLPAIDNAISIQVISVERKTQPVLHGTSVHRGKTAHELAEVHVAVFSGVKCCKKLVDHSEIGNADGPATMSNANHSLRICTQKVLLLMDIN